ncbi:hypothetical protein Tco_0712189 [Tanacetum coccineum]
MDDPNITMEEYIRLEEEKACRNVFDDTSTSQASLSCEPTVSSLNNNEIDFRISFDESDDEDYMVIFDKNPFSYKIISVDNLKSDSENDNDKVNMPLFPSPEPTASYFDNLDYLKNFENEYPTIVYNDALTSKSDFLTEPTVNPQHVNEFNKTSLYECDEEEQNVLYFNDLFPFNIIYPDGLKSDEDNDDMSLPPRDQRHQYLRFEGLVYTNADITNFKERLGRIYGREIHWVSVFDFGELTILMDKGLSGRMLMEYRDAQGQSIFTSRAWRRLFEIRSPLVYELILEFFSTFRFREAVLDLDTAVALYNTPILTNIAAEANLGEVIEVLGGCLSAKQARKDNGNGDDENGNLDDDGEAHSGKFSVYGIHLNLETIAQRESFSNQAKAQFKGNEGDLALEGYTWHSKVGKLKQTIPNLKWRTKGDIQDCGVFTMLHMETFNGGTAANWYSGLCCRVTYTVPDMREN